MTLTLMCSTVVQYVICATTIYVLSGIHTGVFTVQCTLSGRETRHIPLHLTVTAYR